MATVIRGPQDERVLTVKQALDAFEASHAGADASLYRQNQGSIRVRVIDRRFEGMTRSRRHDEVWGYLNDQIKDDSIEDVSMLLLLAPQEQKNSMANLEFEDPIPSHL